MVLYSKEIAGKSVISVIVACVVCIGITKWAWALMKEDPNLIKEDDPESLPSSSPESRPPARHDPNPTKEDDPASRSSSSAESHPPAKQNPNPTKEDDLASLPSSLAKSRPRPKQDSNPIKEHDPASLPSSSAKSRPKEEYDVFLSFRGTDTRRGVTTCLYHELLSRQIKAFMDDRDIGIGSQISPSLQSAIEKSRFAIVILSPKYASSRWCLEELTKIMECMQDNNRILPLFYNVIPSDVRDQNKGFKKAFKEHEKKKYGHDTEKLKQWREDLRKVASLSGWVSRNFRSDREIIQVIVKDMCGKLRPIESESAGDLEAYGLSFVHELFAFPREIFEVYGMGGIGINLTNISTILEVYGMGGIGINLIAFVSCLCFWLLISKLCSSFKF